jgi:hypothetical protein
MPRACVPLARSVEAGATAPACLLGSDLLAFIPASMLARIPDIRYGLT